MRAIARPIRWCATGRPNTASRCSPNRASSRVTLTCVNNGAKPGGRVVDVPKLQKLVKDQGFLIDGGYGKIKGKTFRISNMGDETEATMNPLIAALDKAVTQL